MDPRLRTGSPRCPPSCAFALSWFTDMMIASSGGLNCPDQTLQGLVSHRPSQELNSQDPLLVAMKKVSAFEVVALPSSARAANAELPAVAPVGPPGWLPHTQTKPLPSFHT